MDTFNQYTKGIQTSFSPFAKRTQQYVNERLGRTDEKTDLPPEYLALEKRIDDLKAVHVKLLSVTGQYQNEGYDYPANLRETVGDFSKTISEKIGNLAQATTTAEAQAALTKSTGTKSAPKTLNHALGRASAFGAETLGTEDALGQALSKYAVAEEKIGNARLAQDNQINSRFTAAFNTTLNTSLQFASKARKSVQNARLNFDAAKASLKVARPEKQDAARVEVEQAEDAFVAAVEEATTVMKNVLDTPEPLRNLADLVSAQLAYHKEAYEVLSQLAPEIDDAQVKQEASYRNKRTESS